MEIATMKPYKGVTARSMPGKDKLSKAAAFASLSFHTYHPKLINCLQGEALKDRLITLQRGYLKRAHICGRKGGATLSDLGAAVRNLSVGEIIHAQGIEKVGVIRSLLQRARKATQKVYTFTECVGGFTVYCQPCEEPMQPAGECPSLKGERITLEKTHHNMTQKCFLDRSQEAGLYRAQMNIRACDSLCYLIQNGPQPLQPTRSKSGLQGAPSALPHMGLLIKNQFARFDREAKVYTATDAGREWLAQVQDKVLSKQHA